MTGGGSTFAGAAAAAASAMVGSSKPAPRPRLVHPGVSAHAASNASTSAVQFGYLAPGCFERPFCKAASTLGPKDGFKRCAGGGGSQTIWYTSVVRCSATNGLSPVSISYAITASEY